MWSCLIDGHKRGGMPRANQVCLLCAAVVFVCTVLYVPLLLSLRPPVLVHWMSMKRDLRLYVSSGNETSLIDAHHTCDASHAPSDLVLVVVVCSAVAHWDARAAIRTTWGSLTRHNESSSRLVFLLGRPDNESQQDAVVKESEEHGDVVQQDFVDTYNNLTLKSVFMLKWASEHCSSARFLLKTDDDTYVNLAMLESALKQRGRPRLLMGKLICGAVPIRDRKSKWFTPANMFNEPVYPNYLSGTAYVVSRDLVTPLYKTALETPLFHLEDVFLTGICARKLRVRPRNQLGFNYQRRTLDPCVFRRIFSSHRMSPADLRRAWGLVHQPEVHCNMTARTKEYHPPNCF